MYDGDSDSATRLAGLTGSIVDDTFKSDYGEAQGQLGSDGTVSSTNKDIFINFQSDDYEEWAGFKIQFDAGKFIILFYIYLQYIWINI